MGHRTRPSRRDSPHRLGRAAIDPAPLRRRTGWSRVVTRARVGPASRHADVRGPQDQRVRGGVPYPQLTALPAARNRTAEVCARAGRRQQSGPAALQHRPNLCQAPKSPWFVVGDGSSQSHQTLIQCVISASLGRAASRVLPLSPELAHSQARPSPSRYHSYSGPRCAGRGRTRRLGLRVGGEPRVHAAAYGCSGGELWCPGGRVTEWCLLVGQSAKPQAIGSCSAGGSSSWHWL